MKNDIEKLSAKLHLVYQEEAKRQGNVKYNDDYETLPENIKEFDRVLARYIYSKLDECKDEIISKYGAEEIDVEITEGILNIIKNKVKE